MRALLEVSVLIALLDRAHPHHGAAREWLAANIKQGWASCPITQNGCVRILSQASYPGARPVAQVTDTYLLALAVRHSGRLATFDSGIALSAVKGATTRHLVDLLP